jgi:hypothetical protein
VSAQLSTNLRDVTIGTGSQHAGSSGVGTGGRSVGTGEGDLLAKPRYLLFKAGNPRFNIVIRHGRDLTALARVQRRC